MVKSVARASKRTTDCSTFPPGTWGRKGREGEGGRGRGEGGEGRREGGRGRGWEGEGGREGEGEGGEGGEGERGEEHTVYIS